jgi:hypothetical protein
VVRTTPRFGFVQGLLVAYDVLAVVLDEPVAWLMVRILIVDSVMDGAYDQAAGARDPCREHGQTVDPLVSRKYDMFRRGS